MFFTLLDSNLKLYHIFLFFFLIMIHTLLVSKNVLAFLNGQLVFRNISHFLPNICLLLNIDVVISLA